jgi:hypothetical protein
MLTVSENGVVSIWKWTKPGKAPHQPSGVIKLDASSAKGHAILNARFTGGTTITVVYGTYIKPQFQRVVRIFCFFFCVELALQMIKNNVP